MKKLIPFFVLLMFTFAACQSSGSGQDDQTMSESDKANQIKEAVKASLDSMMLIRDSIFNVRVTILKETIDADPLLAMKVSEFDAHDEGMRANMDQFQMVVNNFENGTFDLPTFESMANDRKELAKTYMEKMKVIGHVYFNPDIPN
jgi:hypothetical protein